MKSTADMVDLKAQWKADPCWDIEDTQGFEEHYEELKAYRLQMEEEWEERRARDLEAKAWKLGMPGNTKLAAYIERLEDRISQLEEHCQDPRRHLNPHYEGELR